MYSFVPPSCSSRYADLETLDLCSDGSGCCKIGYNCCPNSAICCEEGSDCFSDRCCPSGQVPCGDLETGGCIDPETSTCCGRSGYWHSCDLNEQCCGDEGCYDPDDPEEAVCCEGIGYSCPANATTCCGTQCCYPWAYCGAGRECESDPDATCTTTTVVPSTILATATQRRTAYTTTTEKAPPLYAAKCPKTSSINHRGSTIKLDSNCVLTVLPPHAERRHVTAIPTKRRAPRQTASCYFTKTVKSVSYVTSRTTIDATVTSTGTVTESLCYPLTISDCHGDVLKLNSKCSLQFTPGTKTCSSSPGPITVTATRATSAAVAPSQNTGSSPASSAATAQSSPGIASRSHGISGRLSIVAVLNWLFLGI